MREKVNVSLLEKAIGKYYEDQKKKYHIAPSMCEGAHGEATSDGLIEKVLTAGRTLEEVIALERSILKELRPDIDFVEGMRLEYIIDLEKKKREKEPKDDRVVKYLERTFGK